MPKRVYPPSGQIISVLGVILNDQERDVLLQVIEATLPEASMTDRVGRRVLLGRLLTRLRDAEVENA